MSFDERYRLLELVEDENAKTFVAFEISTGKKVTVFLFVGEQARKHVELLSKLQSIERRHFPELIETGKKQGNPYVVMQSISRFSELKDWVSNLKATPPVSRIDERKDFSKVGLWRVPVELQSKLDRNDKASLTMPSPPAASSAAPGEFTQMFQAAASPSGDPAPEAPKSPLTETSQEPRPAAGEFTRMFQKPAIPIGEFNADARASSPEPPAPGEFTQTFQSVSAPIGESTSNDSKGTLNQPAASPIAPPAPGEFTRFFHAVTPSSLAPTPIPSKPEAKGDFARHFGSGGGASEPPSGVTGMFDQSSLAELKKEPGENSSVAIPSSAYTPPAGEFTRIFSGTSADGPAHRPDAIPPSSTPTPAPPAAPGEYTRMFSAPSIPPGVPGEASPALSPPPSSPTPAKQASNLLPILIGAILLLLAIIAVIVIAVGK